MKKYSWLVCLLASVLAFGGCGEFVGSDSSDSSFSSESSSAEKDPSDFAAAQTDDEIVSSIAYAWRQFCAYKGNGTCNWVYRTEFDNKSRNRVTTRTEEGIFTLNPQEEKDYLRRTRTTNQENQIIPSKSYQTVETEETKSFEEDGSCYAYTKTVSSNSNREGEETEELYLKLSDGMVEEVFLDGGMAYFYEKSCSFCDVDIGDLPILETGYSEYKAAYERVYAEQLATEQVKNPQSNASVALETSNESGELSVTVRMKTEKVVVEAREPEEIVGVFAQESTLTLVAKDGRLTQISGSAKKDTPLNKEDDSFHATFAYEFNETEYGSLATALPEDESTIRNSAPNEKVNGVEKTITLHLEGTRPIALTRTVEEKDTVPVALEKFTSVYSCDEGSSSYALDGWYTDENYTNKFDPLTATREELLTVERLYARVIVEEGAVIVTQNRYRDDRSDAYKIVFGEKYMQDGIFQIFWYACDGQNDAYDLSLECDEVFVNGERTESSELSYEDEGFYYVECVNVYTDTDESIFTIK